MQYEDVILEATDAELERTPDKRRLGRGRIERRWI